ncbi:copper resistance protein CopC [Microbacterium sp. P03]|uniref:copper resistance CopC family protein n=1 Tax=Microbacterium sp. P03 TaxID=3366946 RepID=UPI0037461FDE
MDTYTRRRAQAPRRLTVVAASVLAAFALVFVAPLAASAHDELIGSDPAADSTVEALPAQLTLTFSGPLLTDEGSAELQVTDTAGTSLLDGAPSVQDNTVTQALAGTATGTVTVLWRVASGDGHPISGQFAFTATGAPTPAATASASATTTPTAVPTPSEASVVPTTAPTSAPAPSGDASPLPWILGVVALLVVAAVVYLLVSRARRTRDLSAAQPKASPTPSGSGSDDPAER